MTWIEIQIPLQGEALEPVGNLLFEIGALGIIEEKGSIKVYVPYNSWSEEVTKLKKYLWELKTLGLDVDPEGITLKEIPDQDWQAAWKVHFKPIFVSERIVITPPWEKPEVSNYQMVIRIDPGRAFGTGHHPTTRMTLRFLERCIRSGMRVLDIGTGTGILAIAAVRMGAARVIALDIDGGALENARRNLRLNRVQGRVSLVHGGVGAVKGKFDLILANLDRRIIMEILPSIAALLAPGGRVLFSGILIGGCKMILEKCAQLHLKAIDQAMEGEWVCVVLGWSRGI